MLSLVNFRAPYQKRLVDKAEHANKSYKNYFYNRKYKCNKRLTSLKLSLLNFLLLEGRHVKILQNINLQIWRVRYHIMKTVTLHARTLLFNAKFCPFMLGFNLILNYEGCSE